MDAGSDDEEGEDLRKPLPIKKDVRDPRSKMDPQSQRALDCDLRQLED